jgi:UDP-N-acetylmuramate--alanine ligase
MITNRKNMQLHFIGIGGIGMSGIAEVLLSLGYSISGSDVVDGQTIERLREKGANIFIGHQASNIGSAKIVVYSSAVKEDNPEYIEARKQSIPIMKRAEMIAELMRIKHGIAIAGTHGKTTTTSFLATILTECGSDPTFFIGGLVSNLNGHARAGEGQLLLSEADESDGSFLLFNPIMSVITNIDFDHMDYYGTERKLINAFKEFANKIPFYGLCALNIHDERLMYLSKKMKKPWITFGISGGLKVEPNFAAKNINYSYLGSEYDLYLNDQYLTRIKLSIPGRHNILNSLGAISVAYNLSIPIEAISNAIVKCQQVGRRFERLYSYKKFEIIDDYAHHPTEIDTFLSSLKEIQSDREVVVIFEPHRYTRTRDCWAQFLHCFNNCKKVYFAPIYPASEHEIAGISSSRLAEDINRIHPKLVTTLASIDEMEEVINSYFEKDCLLVTLGAGSIGKNIRSLVKKLNS